MAARKLPPAKHLLRVAPRDEDAIIVITELLAAGRWKTGVSTRQYADAWGVSESKVLEWYRASCAVSRIVVNPGEVIRIWDEVLRSTVEVHHRMLDPKDELFDPRGGLVAGKTVLDACAAFMKTASERDQRSDSRNAFKVLIELGWQPPATIDGLPEPSVMSPTEGGMQPAAQADNGSENSEDNYHGS